MNIPSFEGLG